MNIVMTFSRIPASRISATPPPRTTAGFGVPPLTCILVLAGSKPGNEIQSPMAEVILGGLLSSTFLNLVVVPVLFARWGAEERRGQPEEAGIR